MTRVGVFGVGGRMGLTVAQAVMEDKNLQLVAAVDPGVAGSKIGDLVSFADQSEAGLSVEVAADSQDLVDLSPEVMIDFTHLEAARENIEYCAQNSIHAVVGSSGFEEAEHETIRAKFTSSNCLIAANFAIGAVLMMRLAEIAAPYFETAEIVEAHHDGKKDSPSGTAIATAERMAASSSDWAEDPNEVDIIPGARGAKGAAGIPIHSIRMRGMTAHQEVILGSTSQTLTVRHDSFDRWSFMPGVVLAAQRVGELPGLTIGLDKALGF